MSRLESGTVTTTRSPVVPDSATSARARSRSGADHWRPGPGLRGVGAVGLVAGEAAGQDLAGRAGDVGAAFELDDARPVGRVVEGVAYAGVVERRPAHVEEHVVQDRLGVAVELPRRSDFERREALAAGTASRTGWRGSSGRRSRAGPSATCCRGRPAGAALTSMRSAKPAGRACGTTTGSAGCGPAVRRARRPRMRTGTARCRAARDPRWRVAAYPPARRTRTGSVSLCRNSASGRVRWTVIVRARASVSIPAERSQRAGRLTHRSAPTMPS